ncbi:MAG: WD40 repeat domain-containing protein, partial [Phycisphaerae bacterium]
PDGRLLAAGCVYGSDRGTIMLWSTADGKLLDKLAGLGSYVISVTFSPDGKLLAGASRIGGVCIWDVGKSKVLRELPVAGEQVYAVAFSPDGTLLAAGGLTGQIRLWEVPAWGELHGERGHRGSVVSLAASADGQRVVTGGQDGTVRLWEGRTGIYMRRLAGDHTAVSAVTISPDGRTVAACGANETVQIWDAATGKLRHSVRTRSHVSPWLAFLPGGAELIAFGPNGAASEIDAVSGKVRLLYPGGDSSFTRAALSADGHLVASFDRGLVDVRELRTGRKVGAFGVQGAAYFYAIDLDPSGRLLACDAGQRVVLIELDSGKVVRQIATGRRRVGRETIAFSPDGRALAASEADGAIALWSVRTGEQLTERKGHRGPVTAMAFLTGGKRLLSGSTDGTAILWDLTGTGPTTSPAGADIDANDLKKAWADLASTDATQAEEAVFRLIDAGGRAVALLSERLESVVAPLPQETQKLIAELGHRRFAVRRLATEKLARLGPVAEPALRQAAGQSDSEEVRARARRLLDALDDPHQRSGLIVRPLRAVHVLEQIGSDEARAILRRLSSGSPHATLTRRVAAALARLEQSRR